MLKPIAEVIARRRAEFKVLHERGCFVIPNPWDVGSARYLASLGFRALATTSSGFAFSRGLPDAEWAVPRDAVLGHLAEMVAATELPVSADFESGYAHDPAGVAENVRLCVDTGVAGLSIEDATGDATQPLYEASRAVERIAAARRAIDAAGGGVVLTARTEAYLVGHHDPLKEALTRLPAFAAAGADVLFAPGVREKEEIAAVVAAVAPKPVNVLMMSGMTMRDLAALGVRRISVGSALARAAWTGFLRAATPLVDGSFVCCDGVITYAELNGFFQQHRPRK
jgi:2-methylisocitrate lyase-like PEP mutase family enzyme